MKLVYFIALSMFFCFSAKADVFVIDGDSLKIDQASIRLNGIDAPEYYQTCKDKNNKQYNCGIESKNALEAMVKGKNVRCDKVSKDIYNRELCECFANGVNLNQKMLEKGWAVAYRTDNDVYKNAEKQAKQKKLGIWQGKFMKPELYRILFK